MRIVGRARWALAGLLVASCAPFSGLPAAPPGGKSSFELGPDGMAPKAWYVDKEDFGDGQIYPGRLDAEAPTRHLLAVGALPLASVTADSSLSGLPPSRAIDGDLTTQWANGTYQPATAWLAVRLSTTRSVSGIAVKTGPLAGAATYDIQTSTDGTTWSTAAAGQRNTTWGLETKTFVARQAAHVRLFFRNDAARSATRFSVFELQALGETGGTTPTPTPTPTTAPSATPAPGAGSAYYPDLRATSPARLELITQNGRKLLRFDTTIPNVGRGAFQVRASNANGQTRSFQEVLDPSGRVVESKYVGTFEYHPAHNHFHLGDVALYQLRRDTTTGTLQAQGYKVSFCLLDSVRYLSDAATRRYTTCGQTLQGISRGWGDLYDRTLAGQSFDVTGYPAGTYYVIALVDPTNKFLDPNHGNEVAWTRISLDPARNALSVLGTGN